MGRSPGCENVLLWSKKKGAPWYLGPIWGLFGAHFYLFGACLGVACAEGGFIDLRGVYCLQLQVNKFVVDGCHLFVNAVASSVPWVGSSLSK